MFLNVVHMVQCLFKFVVVNYQNHNNFMSQNTTRELNDFIFKNIYNL